MNISLKFKKSTVEIINSVINMPNFPSFDKERWESRQINKVVLNQMLRTLKIIKTEGSSKYSKEEIDSAIGDIVDVFSNVYKKGGRGN